MPVRMIPTRYSRHLLLLGIGVIFWPSIAAHSAILLTVRQDGNDVVVIGSGSANINDLTSSVQDDDYTNALTDYQIHAGPVAHSDDQDTPDVAVDLWSGITGPTIFGTNPNIYETPSSGFLDDLFGIVADNGMGQSLLVLPPNYISDTSLDGTSRFSNITLAQLGLSPGVFTWNWGMGQNADSFELRIEPVPVPAPLPLAGVPIAWNLAKRMRRASRDSPAKAAS